MWLPLPNATYRIKSAYYNNTYLTLDNAIDGTALVLAQLKTGNDAKKQKWVLRNQGYTSGPDRCQIVTLQYEGDRGPNDLGFFLAEKPARGSEIKYSKLASTVTLGDNTIDNVTIRFTEGSRDLVLYGASRVVLSTRNGNPSEQALSLGQQWIFEED